jgi:hypothetical protein
MKFTIRELFLVTVIVALATGAWLGRQFLATENARLKLELAEKERTHNETFQQLSRINANLVNGVDPSSPIEAASLRKFRQGLEQKLPNLWEREKYEAMLDVPGYLTEAEIDRLTAEVKPGMTAEQISVLFGLKPENLTHLSKPNTRTWIFQSTDSISPHGSIRWFEVQFKNGFFVDGVLFAPL